VPDEVTAEVLLWAVQSLSGKDTTKVLFTGTTLFDIYVGDEVPKGMKSMAFSVTMQPFNTTLTEDDIQRISQAIISKVMKSTGGELRG
jgi:phenylalanyl-tRNA synthetase beta chain